MTHGAAAARSSAGPAIGWQRSALRAFCEVPLDGGPYRAVEIQRLERNGVVGHTAVLYRRDGALDLLFEEQLGLDLDWAKVEPATAHLRVGRVEPVRFDTVRCRIDAREIDVAATFRDLASRSVDVRVRAEALSEARPMSTPMPAGAADSTLRFFIMDVFHLLPRGHEVRVAVEGEEQAIRPFLLPASIAPYTATRAADQLLLASLGPAERAERAGGAGSLADGGLTVRDGSRWMSLAGLPLAGASGPEAEEGAVRVDSSLGTLARGRYRLENGADAGAVRLEDVHQDWSPPGFSPTRLAMRHLRRFRRRGQRWRYP